MVQATIRGIIFDFGGVFTNSAETVAWLESYDQRLGLEAGTIMASLYSGEDWEQVSTGKIPLEEYWSRTGQQFEARLPADFARLKSGLFLVERIDERTVALAHDLRRAYPMALCSNALLDLKQVLDQRPDIRELFDVIVISVVEGLRKPDPAIFRLTAERMYLPPEACLLIDDKQRNISAAAAVGMPGIVFESANQAREEIARLGVML
jgi:putative hydrolase of the HAD superfamily